MTGVSIIIGLIASLIVGFIAGRLSTPRPPPRDTGLHHKLDALMQHLDVRYDPLGALPPAAVQALRDGKKIEAIKIYHEHTGVGLKEAHEQIIALQQNL